MSLVEVVCSLDESCDDLLRLFFCKQKTAYEMRISDWSSDVCSSDLQCCQRGLDGATGGIGGMHDAAMAVTAFTRQMQVRAARFAFFLGERHALFEQPVDAIRAAFDGEAHGVLATQAEIGRAHV